MAEIEIGSISNSFGVVIGDGKVTVVVNDGTIRIVEQAGGEDTETRADKEP